MIGVYLILGVMSAFFVTIGVLDWLAQRTANPGTTQPDAGYRDY